MTVHVLSDELLDKRYMVLLLRLLVNSPSEFQYGELLAAHGQSVGRFRHLDELPNLIARYLEQQRPGVPT